MADLDTVETSEDARRKLANHSSRLEHGDRRMSSIELDVEALKKEADANKAGGWKVWLGVFGMVVTLSSFAWWIIEGDVDAKVSKSKSDLTLQIESLKKEVEQNADDLDEEVAERKKAIEALEEHLSEDIAEAQRNVKAALAAIDKDLEHRGEWMDRVNRILARAEIQAESVEKALAEFKTGRWSSRDQEQFEKLNEYRFTELRAELKELRELITELRNLTNQ